MAWGNNNGEFTYEVVDDFDFIIDEAGNKTINLRKIRFNGSENTKLDLRSYYISEAGERMGKGVNFLTEEGPHNLVETMSKLGYGKTKNILMNIKDREDFKPALNTVLGKESEFYDEEAGELNEEYFDPSTLLGEEWEE